MPLLPTHSSTLAWEIPWTEEPGRLQSMGSRWVGHNWVTSLSLFTFMHWRKKWQPTPVFLPGESQGREPGGLPSMGSHRVGHDWCDLAAAAADYLWKFKNKYVHVLSPPDAVSVNSEWGPTSHIFSKICRWFLKAATGENHCPKLPAMDFSEEYLCTCHLWNEHWCSTRYSLGNTG